jgi:Ni,Fe-hydrogenase III small subunit
MIQPVELLRLIRRFGRLAEPAPAPPAPEEGAGADEAFVPPRALRGSAQCRHVDVGSCNGCEVEIGQAFGPVYDADRYGARLVASPRHADVLLVTGVVTHNMADALTRTVEATPEPRVVVAIGDCAIDGGLLVGGFGVRGTVGDVTHVDLTVPGCPPEPDAIVAALRRVTGR